MMSNDIAGNGDHGTNRSRRLRSEELSDADTHQVELGALSILRAQEIQKQKDIEDKQAADTLQRNQVGLYHEKRSLLMLMVEYGKLLIFIALVAAAYFGIQQLLKFGYVSKPEVLATYLSQLKGGGIAFVVLMVWLVLRIYFLWANDIIHADVDNVYRSRKPIWYLGILKVSFKVETKEARCNPMPTNFEAAMIYIGFNASSVDIDTMIQKDEPLHNLKYVKNADELEAIINSVRS